MVDVDELAPKLKALLALFMSPMPFIPPMPFMPGDGAGGLLGDVDREGVPRPLSGLMLRVKED